MSGINNLSVPVTIPNTGAKVLLEIYISIGSDIHRYIIESCSLLTEQYNFCRGIDYFEIEGYGFDGGYGKGYHREKGIAHIYFSDVSCPGRQLQKVIIFVDGFDAGNKQHHEQIWDQYLNSPFLENNSNKKLGDELLKAGYDIVILDQVKSQKYNSGGAGQIENNGLVLAKLLDSLYSRYHSTLLDDFIVVGASMGGLVSRFGLAYMETNNMPHHTKLFVSFDSPQNGASIPIGLQQTLDNFLQYGILSASSTLRNNAHFSIAAKQMLLNHSSSNSEYTQAHPHRQRWLNNVAAVGNYPKNLRMVAINNGNLVGSKKNINGSPPEIPNINEKDKYFDMGLKRIGLPGCTSQLCYVLEAKAYAQSQNGRYKTLDFYVNALTAPLHWVSPGVPFISNTRYAFPENGTSHDIAPGSRLRQDPIEKNIGKNAINIYNFTNGLLFGAAGTLLQFPTNNLKYVNFIPSISSAAYIFPANEPRNLYKNFTGVNLRKCAGTTPFDTVYAFADDMPHVGINSLIANAFRNEVNFPKAKSTCAGDCLDYRGPLKILF